MKKKLLKGIGAALASVSIFTSMAAAAPMLPVDAKESANCEEISMLLQLGIMQATESDEGSLFDGEAIVTRGEFYEMLSKITGKTSAGNYTDSMTSEEALKDVLDLLGYTPYAKEEGWAKTAAKIGLKAPGEYLTRETAAKLLYDALDTKVLEVSGFGGNIKYSNKNTETLLEQMMDMKRITGKIVANSVSAIPPYSVVGENYINIGGVIYKHKGLSIADDIGRTISAIVSSNDEYVYAYYYEKAKKLDEILINGADVLASGTGVGKIHYESKNGDKTERFSTSAVVVYNGEVLTSYDDDVFRISGGSILLTSSVGGGELDLVYIMEYDSGVANGANEYMRKVFFKHGKEDLTIPEESEISVWIDGKAAELSDIKTDDAVDIFRSANDKKITLRVTTAKVKGEFRAYIEDEMEIGEKTYLVADDNFALENCKLGQTYNFIVNSENRVVSYVTSSSDSVGEYGYLFRVTGDPTLTEEGIRLKFFTNANEFESYPVADKIKIDGKKYEHEDFWSEENPLLDATTTRRQLVKFVKDKDAKISEIYTESDNTSGQNNNKELRLDVSHNNPSNPTRMYRNTFGINYRFTGSSLVFVLPPAGQEDDEDAYRATTISEWGEDYKFGNYRIYNTDTRARNIGLFVCYEATSAGSGYTETMQKSSIIMVEKSYLGENDEGDVGYQLEYYQGSTLMKTSFEDEDVHNIRTDGAWDKYPETMTARDVKRGDIMQINTNARGEVTEFKMLFRCTEQNKVFKETIPDSGSITPDSVPIGRYIHTVYGELTDIYGGTITVSTTNDPDNDSELYNRNFKLEGSTQYTLYENGHFTPISSAELSFGDKVFVRAYNYIPYNVIIIRD